MGTINYEKLAIHYKNEALMNKAEASIFLENKNDEAFWNAQIQGCKPGNYNFVYATRNGNSGLGCHSCDKFNGFLSKKFFVCFDSDWKLLLEKPKHPTKKEFYAQTYAYSWESHCCYADTLQNRFVSVFPKEANQFDFSIFLKNLSKDIYVYFLRALCASSVSNISPLFEFYKYIPNQAKKDEIKNNGEILIANIVQKLDTLRKDQSFNETAAKLKYKTIGLEEDNSYLYIKGHIIYDLIVYIGNYLTNNKKKFISDVLHNPMLAQKYSEANKMHDDLTYILT